MDTKLKKINKKKVLVITLCILIPALVLVAMYPMMENAMLDYQKQREQEIESLRKDEHFYSMELNESFVNYAVEASYYLYGRMFQKQHGIQVDFGALDEYGWVNDYYYVQDQTQFYAEYGEDSEDSAFCQNTENAQLKKLLNTPDKVDIEKMYEEGLMGYLLLTFDSYGHVENIEFTGRDDLLYNDRLYQEAMDSINQYEVNAETYAAYYGIDVFVDEEEITIETAPDSEEKDKASSQNVQESSVYWGPKNFRAIYAVYENSGFVWSYIDQINYIGSYTDMYLEIGALIVIFVMAVLVAAAALILPFFKKLETGWERLFSIPAEIVCGIAFMTLVGAVLMFEAMSYSNMYQITEHITYNGAIKFMGNVLTPEFCYGGMLVLNFLGWACVFFMEYIVVAAFRQFICRPKYYLKNRFLIIRFMKWCGKWCKKAYNYVLDIDINEKMTQSILKIVGANFIILTVLCCLWVFGIVGLVIYTICLYWILQKKGKKIQEDYHKVLNALKQIADGNLKVEIEGDLGIFAPMSKELVRVQDGFSKAVMEEAKSQNMKTELITNVSHDLKTPLTAIITYVDLLKQEGITEEARASYIATLDQKSQRLKVLIEDLFEVSKANSGNIKMNYMEVDIISLMKQVRSEMGQQIEESSLYFRWNLPDEKIVLHLDGQRTYRVFENLINNILKYSMPYSRVYIDIVSSEEEVQILFRNMSAEELNFDVNRLTDRFVRGDASRNTEGSGLGLAIAKSFVELQNGMFGIEVDGDLFKVRISWKR